MQLQRESSARISRRLWAPSTTPYSCPVSSVHNHQAHNWAVILAGGEGTRLRELSYSVSGDERPKQFCTFFGGKSLLTHTRERVAPMFKQEQTLLMLTRAHEHYYRRYVSSVPQGIVQPSNRGTTPAIALSILEILQRDRKAKVAFFPSDHYYQDPTTFRATVDLALKLAEDYADRILIIGASATYPEVEYGWIEPGDTVIDSPINRLRYVSAFWEKPNLERATSLQQTGCLWNTFVTVGSAKAFADMLAATVPHLMRLIARYGSAAELESIYGRIEASDFSRDVLACAPTRLFVLRDGPSGWTDFGNPLRAMKVIAAERAGAHR